MTFANPTCARERSHVRRDRPTTPPPLRHRRHDACSLTIRLHWHGGGATGHAAAFLGPITLSALTLLMEKNLLRTKRCAGQECGWLFFDTTKNNRRRWCEMRVCGNRAKVRAARQRQRLAQKG
jgi:predicted RNA-binding Zn ribbon-like protein